MDIIDQGDLTFLIDGATNIRDINRSLGWQLPLQGPKTLNGLLMEELESIPENNVGIQIGKYCAEIIQIKENVIKTVKIWEFEGQSQHTEDKE